ncbi:hypothetical protein GCM10007071_10530 [Marinobacter zhanjiangensis]|uniref:Uncharacterized protein n=1 Tax=Marinobacter zhanjiangensis TaxID=578215 RepID=A0ABQ3AVA8_9GAMM|nr:hypothetical protein GCM10007071_10530 [Marinobacter zhanjiangensis]
MSVSTRIVSVLWRETTSILGDYFLNYAMAQGRNPVEGNPVGDVPIGSRYDDVRKDSSRL